MDEQTLKVMEAVAEKSQRCERDLLGHSDDGMVGFALVAPDCIIMAYSVSPVPVADGFADLCLN